MLMVTNIEAYSDSYFSIGVILLENDWLIREDHLMNSHPLMHHLDKRKEDKRCVRDI